MEERGAIPRLPSANCNRRRIRYYATEREGDGFCAASQDIPSRLNAVEAPMSRFIALLGLFLVVLTTVFSEELEIVVTASRVEEDARSTPSYVRVIPEEVIRRGDTVLDALKTIPDIAVKESSPGKEYISMGGFGENGFARTLVLINGRPINRADMASVNWRTIPLDRIERIEVVKGPLSSQYGDQAVAGAVNIITADPDGFEAWARVSMTTNLTNRQGAGAAWSDDVFRVEGGFSREDLRPKRDRSDSNVISTNLKLGGTAGQADIDVRGNFSDAYYELPGGLTEADYLDNPDQAARPDDEVSERRYGASLDTAVSFSGWKISLPLSWQRLESSVNWYSYSDSILDDLRGTIQTDTTLFAGDSIALVPVLGFDANLSRINVKIYSDKDRTALTDDNSPGRMDLGLWLRTKALIGASWVVDAGARVSYYDVGMGSESTNYTPFVYDMGASWVPSPYWAISTRYGRVFRYPTLDEQASYNGFGGPPFNPDLKPEFGHHVTASAEYRKGTVSISAAPYFIAMFDEIAYVFPANVNIGDTYHFGSSISASRNGEIIGVEAAYSYDNAQFVDTGKTVPLVPAHTIYGRFSITPVETLEIGTDGRFTSDFYQGGDNDNLQSTVPGRFVWNVRIEWTPISDLSFYAQVLNLLDDRTPTMVFWNGGPPFDAWYPSEGRVFDFGATWQY